MAAAVPPHPAPPKPSRPAEAARHHRPNAPPRPPPSPPPPPPPPPRGDAVQPRRRSTRPRARATPRCSSLPPSRRSGDAEAAGARAVAAQSRGSKAPTWDSMYAAERGEAGAGAGARGETSDAAAAAAAEAADAGAAGVDRRVAARVHWRVAARDDRPQPARVVGAQIGVARRLRELGVARGVARVAAHARGARLPLSNARDVRRDGLCRVRLAEFDADAALLRVAALEQARDAPLLALRRRARSIFGEPDGASPASYSDGGRARRRCDHRRRRQAHRAKALYSAAKASSVMKGSAARVSIGSAGRRRRRCTRPS